MLQAPAPLERSPRCCKALVVAAVLVANACAGEPPESPRVETAPALAASHSAQAAPTSAPSAAPAAAAPASPDFAEYRRRSELAAAAYTKKDHAGFLEHSRAASQAFPNSPKAIYNLACAFALSGHKTEAIATLVRLVELKTYFDIAADDDFASIAAMPELAVVRARFEALETPVARSSTAFTLPQKDLIPEGIAHDPASGAFFVSSVHLRKIVRIEPKGQSRDLVKEGEHGLLAVLGLAIDPSRRALWACSSAVPEMKGYKSEDAGKAALFELDLASGKLRRKIAPPEPEKVHHFNDLALDSRGDVFVSDPTTTSLYRLPAGGDAFEVFVPPGHFASPGGIALSPDEKTLYVADYSRGIARVDRISREVTFVAPPADATLAGMDGLRMDKGDLLGIQNGIRPHRVVRIALTADGAAARSVTILEMGHPAYIEPTLGVIAGRDLVYVANSQWGSFDKGAIWPGDRLKNPVILRLPLD